MIDHCLMAARMIKLALEEDLGAGDVTTDAILDSDQEGVAYLIAREELILAGMPVFKRVFFELGSETEFEEYYVDGDLIPQGTRVCRLKGRLAPILRGERTALNFLQRLSGVATLTRQFVSSLPDGACTVITDTRKTTPGLRFLERRAVVHGGGRNHRPDLGGGILIKENHIHAAGSVAEAVRRCLAGAPHPLRVEVEVMNESELEEALAAGAEAVLLDNMTLDEIRRCVARVAKKALVEVSGGVSLERVADLADAGVDIISVGALTHSYPAADISLLLAGG